MANKAGSMGVVSNPHLPDIFVDEALSFDLIHNTVRISLASIKMVEAAAPSPNQSVTVGRVVMTVPGAQRLAIALFDFLKKNGLDPATVVGATDAPTN
jgi:hypothetical protein